MTPEERPDPLAEPPRRPRPGEPPPGPDLSVCSHHPAPHIRCDTPPAVILWIGCTRGEHAGPMSFCAAHAVVVGRSGQPLWCAQCGGQVKIFKVTSMDGVSTVAYDVRQPGEPPGPGATVPAALWERAVGKPGPEPPA